MYATWYVLETGDVADPNEVAPGEDGILRHKSGVAVAYGPYGPRSSGVDLSQMAQREAPPSLDREMTAKRGRGYKTR